MVASAIVDGGIQNLDPIILGKVVTFRRNGGNPYNYGESRFYLNGIKLYEVVDLLE